MKRALALLLFVCLGCGEPQKVPAPTSAPAPPPPGISVVEGQTPGAAAEPKAATEPAPEAPPVVVAYVTVTDLEGKPLPGINPIVTTQANAFDKPLAVGALTGPDGKSSVKFLSDRPLFIRAWDPNLNWFPNQVDEAPARSGTVAYSEIKMVQAAQLRAQFFVAGGTPAATLRVEMTMVHPQLGPWWPAECQTDAQGAGLFTNIPAGKYTLEFRAGESGKATRPDVMLMPGEALELGDVALF